MTHSTNNPGYLKDGSYTDLATLLLLMLKHARSFSVITCSSYAQLTILIVKPH